MNDLDKKINEYFEGLVVRKDLVKTVKGNAIVPTYVLEYLLGQYCATSDEDSIKTGIETVKEILQKHFVHRNEANLIRSTIKEKGSHKVIDKVSVLLNEKKDAYEASFSNLGLKGVIIDSDTIKKHPKLLVSGVWCICDLEYEYTEDKSNSPWILSTIKPIQLSYFDFETYVKSRQNYTLEEWIDILIQSMGFNPECFTKRSKLLQLVRLIPYCERNYNLIELGPKGTGKSHIYSEFSPHGILISGGEVTVAKLFVNNSTGKIGLVGYWDTVAFDEFAGKKKTANKALVDILKNYMANKSFSRGIETLGAEASMVYVGNTQNNVEYMLRNSDLFEELPAQFHDSAFLDRIHFYVPGWEIDIIRGEMFSSGYGFVVDYLAEILRNMRNYDYSQSYKEYFELISDISTRDRDSVHKTFSGLMKILFPNGLASKAEIAEILDFAIEGRKRVKDQLIRIDSTFDVVNFGYTDIKETVPKMIKTTEEEKYPDVYYLKHYKTEAKKLKKKEKEKSSPVIQEVKPSQPIEEKETKINHVVFEENQIGVSYRDLFAEYLSGATVITITDPYIRIFYQIRNLMELLELVVELKKPNDEIVVELITTRDEFKDTQQEEKLQEIQKEMVSAGINFVWKFDETNTIHARSIVLNNGWKILLDRGLDVYQQYEMNDALSLSNRNQKFRKCKAFEVTYLRM